MRILVPFERVDESPPVLFYSIPVGRVEFLDRWTSVSCAFPCRLAPDRAKIFVMDLNALLRLVFLEKNDITAGALMGLLLLVLIVILVRSVMNEKTSAVSAGGGATLDSNAINAAVEGAIKKAFGDKSGITLEKTSGGSTESVELTGDAAELKKVLGEREAKIAALMSDLEAVKGQIDAKASGASGAGGGDDSSGLQAKIKELQTKLAEYEIIEDDIADLSIFKEENKKLKAEVEKLRAKTETAQGQVQAVQAAIESQPAVDSVQAAQAAIVEAAPAVAKAPERKPPEPFKLDTDDEVMGEFAQALAGEKTAAPAAIDASLEKNLVSDSVPLADPRAALDALFTAEDEKKKADVELSAASESVAAIEDVPDLEAASDPFGELDTEKMLAEVASLNATVKDSDGSSVLDEPLDTDRLMAEMGMSEAMAEAEAPAPAAAAPDVATAAEPTAPPELMAPPVAAVAPTAASTPPPVPMDPADIAAAANDVPVDDLLAEFKDTDFESGKKGS